MNSENLSYNSGSEKLEKELLVPTSKSYANRALILAALNPSVVIIDNIPESSDVRNMIKCFRAIGLNITKEGDQVRILNSFPECEIVKSETILLETGDGGTTNRFLIPLLALGQNRYQLVPAEKMSERPMDEMKSILRDLGVTVDEHSWFTLKGPYKSGIKEIEVDCSETTQFATGFLLSLHKVGINVIEKKLKTSIPYLNMTKELVKKNTENYCVPVDFSSLSYPLALASFSGKLTVPNCTEIDNYQADSVLIKILKDLGVQIDITSKGLSLEGLSELPSFDIDCSACPDLVPTLCFLASYAKDRSIIRNVEILKYKECDRLQEMLRIMKLFEVESYYELDQDAIIITGRRPHNNAVEVKTERDHRMVMISHLFQRMNGGGLLHDIDCVHKSFPQFFEVMT